MYKLLIKYFWAGYHYSFAYYVFIIAISDLFVSRCQDEHFEIDRQLAVSDKKRINQYII